MAPRRAAATVLPAPLPEREALSRMKTILTTLEQISSRVDRKEESALPLSEVETHGIPL